MKHRNDSKQNQIEIKHYRCIKNKQNETSKKQNQNQRSKIAYYKHNKDHNVAHRCILGAFQATASLPARIGGINREKSSKYVRPSEPKWPKTKEQTKKAKKKKKQPNEPYFSKESNQEQKTNQKHSHFQIARRMNRLIRIANYMALYTQSEKEEQTQEKKNQTKESNQISKSKSFFHTIETNFKSNTIANT